METIPFTDHKQVWVGTSFIPFGCEMYHAHKETENYTSSNTDHESHCNIVTCIKELFAKLSRQDIHRKQIHVSP